MRTLSTFKSFNVYNSGNNESIDFIELSLFIPTFLLYLSISK